MLASLCFLLCTKYIVLHTIHVVNAHVILGFTRSLCLEMASRSIRVNALLPGWVNSSMWTGVYILLPISCPLDTMIVPPPLVPKLMYNPILDLKPEIQQAYLRDTPLNRVADPTEVADAALFLASNGFANNCILNLDGGLSAA